MTEPAIKNVGDYGHRATPETPASEALIDACFAKMNSVYGQYKFKPEQWLEMLKLAPDSTRAICDLERLGFEQLTYGDLRKYYEIHVNLWKSFHARSNSLNDRFKDITRAL